VLKKVLIALFAIILLVSPLVVRWLNFYEGRFQAAEVPRPDLTKIEAQALESQPFVDREITAASGTVLVDMAHANRLQMAELNVLQARLAARGLQLQPITETGDFGKHFRHAKALMIISPGQDWKADEIQQVQGFVDKGGRLLLVTDPTRFDVIYDEEGFYVGLDHDAPHINDLASRFGLVFQTDYLYNTVDNVGNCRNIRLTEFADDVLTQGLDQLVFYAAHSIVSEEPALITAGGETRSSSSEAAENLTVGLLAADGAVLALGDLTFMTEPYNTVYDNDRFVANISAFLSNAEREYELADFPFYLADQVDLVYTGEPLLDSNLLEGGSTLQALFADEGKELTVRATEDDAHDTLFLGLYEQAEEVEPYLEAAQVTLLITPTETLEEKEKAESPLAESPSLTQPLTTTSPITPAQQITPTATPLPEGAGEARSTQLAKNRIVIEPLGEMAIAGTSLLLHQNDGDRNVMVVLAYTEKGLASAMERLTEGNLESCLLHQAETTVASRLALCPADAVAAEDKDGGWQEPATQESAPNGEPPASVPSLPPEIKPEEPPAEPVGSILIVAMDTGSGRYDSMTSAQDYAAILEGRFEIENWSAAKDGIPDLEDIADHDLVILTAGDFEEAAGNEYADLLFALLWDGMPVLLSGAYVGDTKTEAVQRDIQLKDSTHPVAKGFAAGEVVEFMKAPSGSDYEIGVLEDYEEEQNSIVFVRGPASEESDIPSIVTLEDEFGEFRMVLIGFPLYLLPKAPKSQLVLNAVAWLLSP
jgi:hypothetical protein